MLINIDTWRRARARLTRLLNLLKVMSCTLSRQLISFSLYLCPRCLTAACWFSTDTSMLLFVNEQPSPKLYSTPCMHFDQHGADAHATLVSYSASDHHGVPPGRTLQTQACLSSRKKLEVFTWSLKRSSCQNYLASMTALANDALQSNHP